MAERAVAARMAADLHERAAAAARAEARDAEWRRRHPERRSGAERRGRAWRDRSTCSAREASRVQAPGNIEP
jgi:hypothetical protein